MGLLITDVRIQIGFQRVRSACKPKMARIVSRGNFHKEKSCKGGFRLLRISEV
ncbi:hypothetical protein M422DRAFT_33990 [Sphaerobolus stellatus SS14]|uniref:Uncharacterized protein n=1 Tax=Sphaerobolus stellatus (strain SS14) TaxID=990650 RepID=A0A0C9UQI6_SPHS4|nr:hypothetical protein M422DRAFT_33990 [Sphaerobolus stellatus SS14]